MIAEIITYKNILQNLGELLQKSPFKMEYIIKETKIPPATFYRKMKGSSFTPDEALSIAKILNPEEAYLFELKESIRNAKDDIKAGRTFKHQDVIEEIRKELL
ncbi:hypothetical protein [Nubsella zeaxanthinifaciens]|uniref:hypothetical protein n=1 Tax=Nubsella zeaxanthinifaciens TaxID=392412 RepID=UPI000DE286B8|nr:hypothetical protein [Nubsella zeaxanthinifaciens]